MVKFRCNACRFRFEYNTKPKKCPYCGRERAVEEEESAEELIKEVEDIMNE